MTTSNKNSTYVAALVSFLNDTKPYSRKLTEVIEEYRFSDSMNVAMSENMNSTVLTKSAWTYEYYSGGTSSSNPTVLSHRLVMPEFRDLYVNTDPLNLGGFKVGRDEITDISLVPNVFDPKSGTTYGFSDAFVQRSSGGFTPLLEAHDIHLSHGAYTFQIKRTAGDQATITGRFSGTYTALETYPLTVTLSFSSYEMIVSGPAVQASSNTITVTGPGVVSVIGYSDAPAYSPLFSDQAKSGMMAQATATMQQNALDESNPDSLISKIRAMMALVQAAIDNLPAPNVECQTALDAVMAVLDSGTLPNDYKALMSSLEAAGAVCPAPYVAWRGQDVTEPFTDQYFELELAALSPSLYFNAYTDLALREDGTLTYESVTDRPDVVISGITADYTRENYEEFTVLLYPSSFLVKGSASGTIGSGVYNTLFSSTQVSMLVTLIDASSLVPGTEITLTPAAKITIHESAPLETWSLIKVNPKAYSRPMLNSTRYGYIIDQTGHLGFVTILNQTVPGGVLVLTATSSTTFSVSLTSSPAYSGVATVGTPFNDGVFAFTIVAGSAYTFEEHDTFFIEIVNDAPKYIDFALVYGYDADPYDAFNLVYDNVNTAVTDYLVELGFGYDSRFSSLDEASFNLTLAPNVQSGRKWIMRAIPDQSRPLFLQNSVPSNILNLLGTDDPENPNAAVQFDLASHMQIWYASSFTLEFSDNDGSTWTQVGTIPVGSSYSSTTYGISFTLVEPIKPYIAVTLTDPIDGSSFAGGDIITWEVLNNPPAQVDAAGLSSVNVPRLVMFADSYHRAVNAKWVLTATGMNTYTLQGVDTSTGNPIYPVPKTFSVQTDGRYYQDQYLHYGLKVGKAGFSTNDTISFYTYESSPAVLVHGTVSGFTDLAYYDTWYWNGKIGFKLQAPEVSLFENDELLSNMVSSVGQVVLDYVRNDHESAVYQIKSHVDGYWTLYRNSDAVAGGVSKLDNGYIGFTMPPAVQGTVITVKIVGADIDFTFGQDAAIVLTDAGRAPRAGDFIQIERAVNDKFDVSITPQNSTHSATLSVLALHTTDVNVVDHTVLSGAELSTTSPETGVLQGWFQTLLEPNVVGTTPAYFSETGVNVVVRAAATGETVGTLASTAADPSENVYFNWDVDFHTKYLPLNTETLIVTRSGGMNENMKVSITEVLTTWISGGSLTDSSLFIDSASVNFTDDSVLNITTTNNDSLAAQFQDGFTGFLPGYDNLPFDAEIDVNTAFYGAGQPYTAWFDRARVLHALGTSRTEAQTNELLTLEAHLSSFLVNEDIGQTTLEDFLAALAADTGPSSTTDFGVPIQGLGISVDEKPEGTAATSVVDAMTMMITDYGTSLDMNLLDVGLLDAPADTIAMITTNSNIPIPAVMPTGTYEEFDAALMVPAPGAHTINVVFMSPQPMPSAVYVWRASQPTPDPVIFTFTNRTISFTMSNLEECKIIVT